MDMSLTPCYVTFMQGIEPHLEHITCVTAGNITFGSLYKYYKSLPLELFRALLVGA